MGAPPDGSHAEEGAVSLHVPVSLYDGLVDENERLKAEVERLTGRLRLAEGEAYCAIVRFNDLRAEV